MKILSLFDGMACGMIAMRKADIKVDRYVAFEIDKYAIQTSSHNFPMIEHRGDVFEADFTEFRGFDFLVGGSPCTYWSIAQKNNRETEASGMGWELFSQYVRALREAQPMYFIYENNKSMAKAIRESITDTFGFDAVEINSSLVSAQNRQRLYWVGKRNLDGTYSRVMVDQPEDRGILLRDVLNGNIRIPEYGNGDKSRPLNALYPNNCGGWWLRMFSDNPNKQQVDMVVEPISTSSDGKSFCITATEYKGTNPRQTLLKHRRTMVAEPVAINTTADGEKARTLMAGYYKYGTATLITNDGFTGGTTAVAEPVNTTADGKSQCLRATYYKDGIRNLVANGVDKRTCVAQKVDESICSGSSGETGLYAIQCGQMQVREATKHGFTEIKPGDCVDLTQPNSKTRRGRNMADKSNCLMTSCQYYQYCGVLGYATPCEWDENGRPTKAVSAADGKTYPVYEVKDGFITIKGKQYPIKLVDGCYIIRKLTVTECMRLQTVLEWYEFPVSDTQAYKMLGNGWTVEVIKHLINATQIDARSKWLDDLLGGCL